MASLRLVSAVSEPSVSVAGMVVFLEVFIVLMHFQNPFASELPKSSKNVCLLARSSDNT